jgi:hypothetical protein
MKLLMIIYSGPTPGRITSLFETHHVDGWTELDHAHGAGASGRREGTRAWPGESSLFFSAVDDRRCGELRAALLAERDRLGESERLHVMSLPVEDFF